MIRHAKILVALTLIALATGAVLAGETNSKATLALQQAYAEYVVPSSVTNLECISKTSQDTQFVLCTYGEGRWPHKGLWMVDGNQFYALNGKALAALEKLGNAPSHAKLPIRTKVDVPGVMSLFEGVSRQGRLVQVIPEKELSQTELDAYCAYMAEQDKLTIQANERFGPDNPLSEERAAWIEPKLLQLIQHHFNDEGMDYYALLGKVSSTGVRCPE
jgi:hypothetical protein